MLEFLKETTPSVLSKYGADVEGSLRFHNSATPMSTFFELAFKEIYKKEYKVYSPLQLQIGQNEFNLHYLTNTNKNFWAYLCKEYSLTQKDHSTINEIRQSSNNHKHEGREAPSEEDVQKWFKCLYFFSSNYYAKQTGKTAPEWSDAQYEKLYQSAITSSEQQKIIGEQKRTISILTEKSKTAADALSHAREEKEQLRARIEALEEHPDNSAELAKLKTEQQKLLKKIDVLQKQLEEAEKKIKVAIDRITQVSPAGIDSKPNAFKESAIQAASAFLGFLSEKEKSDITKSGKEVCKATRFERDKNYHDRIVYCLYLDKAPKSIDNIRVVVSGKQYEESEIKPLKCNRAKISLHVSVSENIADPIKAARPEDISVVSDMKFLINNVLQWYQLFGDKIRMPSSAPSANNSLFSEIQKKPTSDQVRAINGVMTYPFSYVWGAPGTGKTQFVLSRSILNYIRENKRILVTAPTNNALDQTLKGLIEVFKDAKINFSEIVFRYGIPTHEFATRYPSICEDYGLKKSIEEIDDFIENAQEEKIAWKKAFDSLPQYLEFKNTEEHFNKLEHAFPHHRLMLQRLLSELAKNREDLKKLQSKQEETHQKINKLRNAASKALAKETKLSIALERDSLLKKIGIIDNEKINEKLLDAAAERQGLEGQIEEENCTLTGINSNISQIQESITSAVAEIEKDKGAIISLLELWPDMARQFSNTKEDTLNNGLEKMDSFVEGTRNAISEKRKDFCIFEGKNLEEIRAGKWKYYDKQVKRLQDRKAALLQNAVHNNPESCLVVAATVDKVISTFDPDTTSFSHIFLDEAGYCPLIKGMVLTSFRCPVTLLGDHMQLPPVCELDQAKLAEKHLMPITLFAQSALFVENAFSESVDVLYRKFISNSEPLFNEMRKFALVQSHRFGPELAKVLDEAVYHTGFRGDPRVKTTIYFINAPKNYDSTERISENELIAINKYLAARQGARQEIGILTPYTKMRSQVWQLKRIAASYGLSRDDVMNVHKSQGREWDTVIFSVVDTTKMFFTDSTNRKARSLQLINTAVSRAKRELIIVCDYNFWIRQKNQFIGKLLSVAKEYPDVKL